MNPMNNFKIVALFVFIFLNSFAFASKPSFSSDGSTTKLSRSQKQKSKLQSQHLLDSLEIFVDSQQKLFRVHYSLKDSVNKINPTDGNQNSIPDYIDSVLFYAEYVWQAEKDLGFIPAFPDEGQGGSDAIDIYVLDLGNLDGNYGFTQSNSNRSGYFVIDNNYSELDSVISLKEDSSGTVEEIIRQTYFTFGIQALKITIAHEYFHLVQLAFQGQESQFFAEITATYIEKRVFPESIDFLSSLKIYFQRPWDFYLTNTDSRFAYHMAIYWDYLFEKYGDDDILLKLFPTIANDKVTALTALKWQLQDKGTTINESWCEFSRWCYNSQFSELKGENQRTFSFSEILPELKFRHDYKYSGDDIFINDSLRNLSFELDRVVFRSDGYNISTDTLDFLVINSSNRRDRSEFPDYTIIASKQEYNDSKISEKTNRFYSIEKQDGSIFCSELIVREGSQTKTISYAFPSPFRTSVNSNLYFSASDKSRLYEKTRLTILDAQNIEIWSGELEIIYKNGMKVTEFRDVEILKPGVYFFRSGNEFDESSVTQGVIYGKFAVIE
jgi:hypothetical protein